MFSLGRIRDLSCVPAGIYGLREPDIPWLRSDRQRDAIVMGNIGEFWLPRKITKYMASPSFA